MGIDERIERFLAAESFGVVGASRRRHKYGNKILRCYLQNGRTAIPVHPAESEVEGVACVASVAELPPQVKSISLITPPAVTEQVVEQAAASGIENIWMQPGAQSERAIVFCEERGLNLIADGSCLLLVLGFRDE